MEHRWVWWCLNDNKNYLVVKMLSAVWVVVASSNCKVVLPRVGFVVGDVGIVNSIDGVMIYFVGCIPN